MKESCVDCLKITEDKVIKCRDHTSDARLIKTIDAMSRREARNPCLSITAKPRLRARSPHLSRARRSRLNITAMSKRRARGPHPTSSQWLNAELKPVFQLQMSPASQL